MGRRSAGWRASVPRADGLDARRHLAPHDPRRLAAGLRRVDGARDVGRRTGWWTGGHGRSSSAWSRSPGWRRADRLRGRPAPRSLNLPRLCRRAGLGTSFPNGASQDRRGRERQQAARAPARSGLPALQSALGNAGMRRLMARRDRRVLARFGEPEHKAIGDKALPGVTWRLRKAGSQIQTPFTDFQLTFGDWIALGDWFEDVGEVREMLRPDGKGADKIGQLYYALFAKIRPKTPEEAAKAEKLGGGKDGGLWTEEDAKAVNMRYQTLKTRNIKHFPNPLVGDEKLTTAQKAKRTQGRQAVRRDRPVPPRSPRGDPDRDRGGARARREPDGRGARPRRLRVPLPHRRVLGQPRPHAALEHRGLLGQEGARSSTSGSSTGSPTRRSTRSACTPGRTSSRRASTRASRSTSPGSPRRWRATRSAT